VIGPLMTTWMAFASGGVRTPRTDVVGGSWGPANRASPSTVSLQDRPVERAKLIERTDEFGDAVPSHPGEC
jgi:hypothetical protein